MPNPVIQVRVPEEMLAEIDKRGNRSDVIRKALDSYLFGNTIELTKTFAILRDDPWPEFKADPKTLGQVRPMRVNGKYFRPAHAIDCKCLMCKPPKP